MAVVGRAEVIVRALTEQFRRDLRAAFQQAERDGDAAGGKAGSRFGASFSRAAGRGVGDLDFDEAADGADAAGDDSGRQFADAFSGKLESLSDSIRSSFDSARSAGREAGDDSGDALGDGIERGARRGAEGAEREVSGAGGRLGNILSKIKFEPPDIGGTLAAKILLLIPLVGVLGGALAAVVGGLTAMAAAATFAAGSLAILASGLSLLVGGAITGILAFGGIGKAVGALGKEQASAGKSAVSSARQQEAAARQIEAAEERVANARKRVAEAAKRLADARKNAAREAISDAEDIADAEERLADAQRDAQRAQEDLTRAREDAAERLEDLQLSLRGAVLGEEEAQIRLRKAQQEYQESLNRNASPDDREQARLDLLQAELALDQARDRREDVTKQTEEANKAGIEGSDEVVSAKERIDDANDSLIDAERNLRDERQQAADNAIDNAEAIRKAQEGIADANKELSKAIRDLGRAQRDAAAGAAALSAGAQGVQDAFKDLSPEAKKFAKFLFSLKPILKDLRAAAGKNLFGPLQKAIESLVTGFLPTFKEALLVTGAGLGQFFTQIAAALNAPGLKANFLAVAKGLSTIDPKTQTSAFSLFGDILGNVFRAITGIANAALPTFKRFLTSVAGVTGAFAGKFEGPEQIKKMTELIGRMGDAAATIGGIFKETFGLIGDIFRAALPTGLALNGSLLDSIKNLREFTKSEEGQKRLKQFFENIVPLFKSVGKFIGALGKAFIKLGEDEGGGIQETFDKLTKALPDIGKAIAVFTDKVAPALISIIIDVIDIFKAIAESPFLNFFVGTIGLVIAAIKLLVKAFEIPIVGDALGAFAGVAAAVLGVKVAFTAMGKVLTKLGLGFIVTAFRQLATIIGFNLRVLFLIIKASGIFTRVLGLLRIAMTAALGPVGLIIIGITALVAGLIFAYKNSETFRNIVNGAFKAVRKAIGAVIGFVLKNKQFLLVLLGPIGLIILAFKNFGKIKEFVSKPLGAVIGFFKELPGKIFGFLKDVIAKIVSFGASLVVTLVQKTASVIGAVLKFYIELPGKIAGFLGQVIAKIITFGASLVTNLQNKVSAVVGAVVKFFLDLPGKIGATVGAFGTNVLKLATSVATNLRDKIGGFITSVVDFFKNLPGRIGAFASSIGSKALEIAGKIGSGIKNGVSAAFDSVVGFFKGLPGRIGGFVSSVASKAAEFGKAIFTGIKDGITGTAGAVADLGKSLLNGLINVVNTQLIDRINNFLPDKIKIPGAPDIDLPDNPLPRIPKLAKGATVRPRPGGTLALLAEAGRAESVVDTGLINARLRADEGGNAAAVRELQLVRAILERMSRLGGINIEKIEAVGAPGEQAATSVPRALRGLAFQLGA